MRWSIHIGIILMLLSAACSSHRTSLTVEVYETSASGNKLKRVIPQSTKEELIMIELYPEKKYQNILGFGGAFTESSAYLLNHISNENRELILNAYFGKDGAKYSLTRTHINSCDFSLSNYSYHPEKDRELKNFSIDEDRDDLIVMIKKALAISEDGFKIMASPWTAPPWMKDNNSYVGGKLLPEYYDTWALFFSKYIEAYKKEGIDIWAVTIENEPLGNGNNWESMHFTAEEMADFTQFHLGPRLENDKIHAKILAYDQNRSEELIEWSDVIYSNKEASKYIDGFAVHWYASTFDWFPESLQHTHNLAPEKYLIQTEACIDAEVPHWKDDDWYWSKEATDWGWDWAPENQQHLHPKYVPVYRYATDIIGCLNNWVNGWIDWNMVLDRKGGPNWAQNWCIAPVIADPENDEVYFTPLYYVMAHFSQFIRPGAVRIGFNNPDETLMCTAAQNPDGTIAVIVLNMNPDSRNFEIHLGDDKVEVKINPQALQTIILKKQNSA